MYVYGLLLNHNYFFVSTLGFTNLTAIPNFTAIGIPYECFSLITCQSNCFPLSLVLNAISAVLIIFIISTIMLPCRYVSKQFFSLEFGFGLPSVKHDGLTDCISEVRYYQSSFTHSMPYSPPSQLVPGTLTEVSRPNRAHNPGSL